MDRRGRGASGDNKDYAFSKESEDIAAVVDSRPKGQPVYVFGHSFGGVASLEAAFLTRRITRLMLYEPPLRDPVDQSLAVAARVEALVNKGDLEQAFIAFQTEVVRQSPQEMARMRSSPNWSKLVATIAVHPRQMYAIAAYRFDPKRVRTLTLPVLLLEGEITPSPYAKASVELLRQTLPNPTVTVLKAQEHNAMDGGREVLAQAIINFIRK
ncbi:hypothetical protein F183_A31190 [Bryobacterales bacterium F-183]|nr:hypothetical protein F183_A31190 [Bryobacterales bacterium F-183]